MYCAGQEQKQIREGKAHGRILINSGDVLNTAEYLRMLGKREGYLSNSEDSSS